MRKSAPETQPTDNAVRADIKEILKRSEERVRDFLQRYYASPPTCRRPTARTKRGED